MSGIVVFFLILFILYCTVSWVVPKVLSLVFKRKYKILLRIGRIGIPYLKLCDVNISRKGFTIHIEEISIKSSFFNSELTKLITLVLKDVRINKDAFVANVQSRRDNDELAQNKIDFRNKTIPHFITTFAQFMAIHVYNVSAMLLRSETPGGLIHATASELHLDGSVLQNARTLLVNINLTETCTKILRHSPRHVNEDTCLGELSFAISLEATLVAQGPLSFEKLQVDMQHTNAVINEGFYSLESSGNVRSHRDCQDGNDDNLYDRMSPIIPKNFTVKIEDTSLKGVRENGRIDFNSSLQTLSLSFRFTNTRKIDDPKYLPAMQFSFLMSLLQVRNSREKILVLKHLGLNAELEHNIINIFLNLDTMLVTYTHDVIHKWFKTNFMSKKFSNSDKLVVKESRYKEHKVSVLEKLLKKCIVNGCVQLDNVACLLKLNGSNSSVGFTHVKLILHQTTETRGATYSKFLPKLVLSDRHWQAEMLLESFWWSFKEWKPEDNISKKVHVWGTPLYLGMALVKIETFDSMETKLESLLDTLQLEWSQYLTEYIMFGVKCVKDYNINLSTDPTDTKTIGNVNLSSSLKLTHFNAFFESVDNEYVIIRLNTIQIDKAPKTVTSMIEHLKLVTVKTTDGFYNCVRSEDIADYKLYVKCAHVERNCDVGETSEIHVELLEEIVGCWSCNFHLKVLTLVRKFRDFITDLRNDFKSDARVVNEVKNNNSYNLHVFGIFAFYIEISAKHSAKVSLDDMTVSYNKQNLSVLNNTVVISIDGADIFTIQGLNLSRIPSNAMIRNERLDNENFRLMWNKTWGLTIELFRVCFPYEHEYADAVPNEFISVFKWLKIVHNIKKRPFTTDSPLPSDILVNVKEFLFELSDDPFEVKLRENFVLLVDEHNESLKRVKMLKDRVAELCKVHLHLPAGKVDELYATLNKKNAEVYIQRSKQLSAEPLRTRLFAWSMTDVEIMILADPSIHGTENVVRIMKEIDPDTPWPEEGIEFSTLWCRVVSLRCLELKFQLRDFPQPLLDIQHCYICGQLVGAEQQSPRRAIRTMSVDLGEPWGTSEVERGMQPLKFYHDFNCEILSFSYAFGPCWEPVIAQCDLSLDKIFPPSKDPSAKLSFWDKLRLIYHGRLTMIVQQLTVLMHASLDPYNTTEEMELTWMEVVMDWTNAKFVYKGHLNIFVRTASKYDDLQLLHLPNLKLVVNIQWLCLGDPNDHHNVIYCAPDKIPEYSINQVHDSFRAFRSQNINVSIVMETKPISNQSPQNYDTPFLSFYGSTLRWFENLKLILSGVTRPTRRGAIFNNVRPKKTQLSRHYKKIHLLMGLHKFQVHYWMSFAMQRGCELLGGRLSSSSEHILSLVPIDDGLKHRPKAEWSIVYMNSELNDSEIWLKSALQEEEEEVEEVICFRKPVQKCYCLSVVKVSYGRETVVPNREHGSERHRETPTHRLVVHDLKGAWTKSNRNVAFALFDTFVKNKQIKKNLSTEALKSFRKESNTTPLKRRNAEVPGTPPNAAIQSLQASAVQDVPSPLSKLQSSHAANMLQQLIAEAENKAVVFSDDLSSATRQQHLQGLQACQEDDVQHKNWLIALVNAQVLLKGSETKGYVILSAAKAEILQRIHRPAWKDRTLVSKTTWVGTLECLQYYATVNAGENDRLNENIMWLTIDNIQEKESTVISEIPQVPNMVGSGVSVGAVVSDTVGASSVGENSPIQLQRIVSRCKCEFFYASYGDISVDLATVSELPPPPQEDVGPWDRRQTAVDAFTLMHHDLHVCTNSLQYGMLLDIVNNLLLYVEPHRKEALERLARMRFKLQLHSVEDQRRPIQNLQTQVRSTVSKLRKLEKETYLVNKAFVESPHSNEIMKELKHLERSVYDCKNQLNAQSEELDMMLSCYKESQLLATNRLATLRSDKPLTIVRANEIFFKRAQWRLTEADGQIGIADLILSNFLYTKNSKSDDSVEHLLELGYLRMTNLLPNQIYKEVLCPTEIQSNMPVEHKRVLRIFCREKPPVGGISVKEHFEINVVPLTISLTKKFYNTMLKFCFPERDPDNIEAERGEEIDADSRGKKLRSSGKRNRDSNFYIPLDDVEKMKERAEKNKLFIYIKIPEVPVRLSYKGNKEKNLEDIRDFSIVIPTSEYHNVTWTWLDLLMAIRSDSRKVILSQAIKQKLQIKRNISLDESSSPHEEDKARMLLGDKHVTNETKPAKKGIGGVFKFGK